MFDISLNISSSNFDVSLNESPYNPLDGLMYAYSMETNAALIDDTGVNDGTHSNTILVVGRVGNGIQYNGTNARSDVASNAILSSPVTAVSLMADIYPTAVGQSSISVIQGKAYHDNTSGQSYAIGFTSDRQIRFRFAFSADGVGGSVSYRDVVTTTTVPLNEWSRIICVYEKNTIRKIWINGTEETFATINEDIFADLGGIFTIGAAANASNRRFTGIIDNVMGWNRALSDEEVNQLSNNLYSYADFIDKIYIKTNGVFRGVSQFVHKAGVFEYIRPTIIRNSPDIVKDGLLFNLDAHRLVSYPQSGSTWFDISGNGTDGTLTNGTTFTTSSGVPAMEFDGVDDTVNLTLDLRRDFTLECWAKYDNVTGFSYFGQGPTSTNNGLHILHVTDTSIKFGMYFNDMVYSNLESLTNRWYHLIFTYNNTSPFAKQAFLNGVELIGTEDGTQAQYGGTGVFRIGASYSTSTSNPFADGMISEARAYDRVLTSTEILQNYNETKGRYGF